MDIRQLRRTGRLTQFEVSQRTGIDRTRLSFAECGYLQLTGDEEQAIKRAITDEMRHRASEIECVLSGNPTVMANLVRGALSPPGPALAKERRA